MLPSLIRQRDRNADTTHTDTRDGNSSLTSFIRLVIVEMLHELTEQTQGVTLIVARIVGQCDALALTLAFLLVLLTLFLLLATFFLGFFVTFGGFFCRTIVGGISNSVRW